jgi:hypothetical protein
MAHLEQLGSPHAVLEPTDRRLRSQSIAIYRIAITRQLHHWILTQLGCIIAVWISCRNTYYPLAKLFELFMVNLPRLPLIMKTTAESFGQAKLSITRRKQNRAAVGAQMLPGKRHMSRLQKQLWKKYGLSSSIIHGKVLLLFA